MGTSAISLITLAAGASRRFGSPKQLAQLHGVSLLDHAAARVDQLQGLTRDHSFSLRSILVVGAHYERIYPHIESKSWSLIHRAELWQRGMRRSLGEGVRAACRDARAQDTHLLGVAICLVDQPLIQADHLMTLISQGLQRDLIACADYSRSVGPPIFIPKKEMVHFSQWCEEYEGSDVLKRAVEAERKEYKEGAPEEMRKGGAKEFIESRPHQAYAFEGMLYDIDTPEDLAALQSSSRPLI